jgi:hypothetical protein
MNRYFSEHSIGVSSNKHKINHFISTSTEGLGYNVISMKQMMATWTASNGQTHVETLILVLVTSKET